MSGVKLVSSSQANIVMPELDTGIHALDSIAGARCRRVGGRIKSGHDDASSY
jgi:hypothetical protein